jgi:hypothetical protein
MQISASSSKTKRPAAGLSAAARDREVFVIKRGGRWSRALTGCIALYAMLIYAVLTSFQPIPAAGQTIDTDIGFEICGHGTDPAPPPADTHEHCAFCLAGGHAPVAELPPAPLPTLVAYSSRVRWAANDNIVPPPPAAFRAQPRGPPLSA